MGVRYFNADTNSNLTRPTGFVFPVGLNSNDGLSVDYLVIGGGAGGLVTAAGCVGLGAKVCLIENNFLGGDCLNTGCVPSKAFLKSANVAHQVMNC